MKCVAYIITFTEYKHPTTAVNKTKLCFNRFIKITARKMNGCKIVLIHPLFSVSNTKATTLHVLTRTSITKSFECLHLKHQRPRREILRGRFSLLIVICKCLPTNSSSIPRAPRNRRRCGWSRNSRRRTCGRGGS